jgi:hypothetical protein
MTAELWPILSRSVALDLQEDYYEGTALKRFRGHYPAASSADKAALETLERAMGPGYIEVSPAEDGTRLTRLRYGQAAAWVHPVTGITYYVILGSGFGYQLQPTKVRTWDITFELIEAPGAWS